jgi:hypothetical protein
MHKKGETAGEAGIHTKQVTPGRRKAAGSTEGTRLQRRHRFQGTGMAM